MLNPDDDVSLRRIINVPPRGIGKGVLDALEQLPLVAFHDAPLLEAGGLILKGDARTSLAGRVNRAIDDNLLPARAVSALRAFRAILQELSTLSRQEPVSITLGKTLDRTGYLQALREENTEEAQGRIENLMELVSAAREYEQREPDASLAGFVDRLSLLSETDEEQGQRDARIWLMTMHAAKGLEFPWVVIAGLEEGLFPHSRAKDEDEDIEEERRLCYVGMTRARSRLVLTSAARRRVFGEYAATEVSRFIDEIPPDLLEHVSSSLTSAGSSAYTSPHYDFRTNPYGRGGRRGGRTAEEQPVYAYEDEDQSTRAVRPGARVKHPIFGLGTVLSVEEQPDDVKVTVRFTSVGQKKLMAKFAKLEPA